MNQIQQPRRKFLHTGTVGFCTALFAGMPKISFENCWCGEHVESCSHTLMCNPQNQLPHEETVLSIQICFLTGLRVNNPCKKYG